MKKSQVIVLIAAILVLIPAACLFAVETSSIQYELYMLREQGGSVNATYFARPDGSPLSSGTYYAVDMTKTVSDIQFLVAVSNNLAASSTAQPRISLKFESFKSLDNNGDPFRGGYVVSLWRYQQVTIPVQVSEEVTTDWTFQAQPSTAIEPLTYDGYNGARLRASREVAGNITSNNNGTNKSATLAWNIDKTNHPLGESHTWYYGVGLQFTGSTEFGDIDYLEEYLPGRFSAKITMTVTGI